MKVGDRIKIFQLNDSKETISFPKEAEGLQRACLDEVTFDVYDKKIAGFYVHFLPSECKHVATMVIKNLK